jgi:hypothetical protein
LEKLQAVKLIPRALLSAVELKMHTMLESISSELGSKIASGVERLGNIASAVNTMSYVGWHWFLSTP